MGWGIWQKRLDNALLSVKLPRSSYQCGTLFHSGRHAEAMSPRMRHCDRQECTIHSCRSKFCNHILIAENCLILGDMQRQCLPKWYRHTNTNLFLLSIVIQFNIFINLNQLFLFFYNSIYLSPRISIPLTDIKSLIELFQYSKFHINLCYFFSHRLFY